MSAWMEVVKRHAPHYADLEGIELRDALKTVFMMIGSVAGMMIAACADDPDDREWLSQAVFLNIPCGIESGDRFKRQAKAN